MSVASARLLRIVRWHPVHVCIFDEKNELFNDLSNVNVNVKTCQSCSIRVTSLCVTFAVISVNNYIIKIRDEAKRSLIGRLPVILKRL